jgi:hypothetical protein
LPGAVTSRNAARHANAPVARSCVRGSVVIELPVRITFETVPFTAKSTAAATAIA